MKIFAYIISSLIGLVIGHYLPQGAIAALAYTLISYHLYLGYLVLTAKSEKGFSLPVGQTILTHTAFLLVLIGLPYMREQIPFFSLISLLVPSLAPFETKWLFSGQGKAKRKVEEEKPVDTASATAEDHQEFVVYLRNGRRPFRRPGATVDDEFGAWLADRAKKKAVSTMAGVSSGRGDGLN